MKRVTPFVLGALLLAAHAAAAQDPGKLGELETKAKSNLEDVELWLELGRAQLAAARGRDEGLLANAQESFQHVLKRKPGEPRALVWHGALQTMKAGRLFAAGNLGEAQRFLTQGLDEMDRAVATSPGDPEVRRVRGQTNLRVPEFLGRSALGVEDYEAVLAHASFAKLPPADRAEALELLGTGYSRLGKAEQARTMWQRAVDAAPDSRPAAESKKLLERSSVPARTGSAQRPDRLTGIPDDVSPIMAVASIAFKSGTPPPQTSDKDFDEFMQGLKAARGFMGVRLLQSNDASPMFVIISWWKNRAALVDWYYNPVHQKMIRGFQYGAEGGAGSSAASPPVQDLINHIGIQFYAPLKGGGTLGESFGPRQKAVE